MNHKQRTKILAEYVLSQNHERETLIENLRDFPELSRAEQREMCEDSIWYHAMIVLYGRAEARKELTELLREVR